MFAQSAWNQLFALPQVAIIMACLIPIVAVIAYYWHMTQKVHSENDLKRTMVERGLPTSEIERVIRATAGQSDRHA